MSKPGSYDSQSSHNITLVSVMKIMRDLGVTDFYVKKLAPNDNSKNQPYFGAHLTDLPFIPSGHIVASNSSSMKTSDPRRKIKYQTSLNLSWVDADGQRYPAPSAKLIYYPQYPEVRFSGFLQSSKVNISRWMSPQKDGRSEGRWLILGTGHTDQIFVYLVTPESQLSAELADTNYIEVNNIFWQPDIGNVSGNLSPRDALIKKLLDIHKMGWIAGCKLENGIPKSYSKMNAGGYTLEALLGISPNGIAEPDYLGWEVKQFGVSGFPAKGTKPTTLMTPEPDGGYYVTAGVENFVRKYGYPDRNKIPDRLNFGGKHVFGQQQSRTALTLRLNGFDERTLSINNASGAIEIVNSNGDIAASWSFAKIMDHWKRKHSQTVYVPCMKRCSNGVTEYQFGSNIELGTGASFEVLLSAFAEGNVFYDPGIKLEHASTDDPAIKRRNQFRINHKHLCSLYRTYDIIDIAVLKDAV